MEGWHFELPRLRFLFGYLTEYIPKISPVKKSAPSIIVGLAAAWIPGRSLASRHTPSPR